MKFRLALCWNPLLTHGGLHVRLEREHWGQTFFSGGRWSSSCKMCTSICTCSESYYTYLVSCMPRCLFSILCMGMVFVFLVVTERWMMHSIDHWSMHLSISAINSHAVQQPFSLRSSTVFRTMREREVGANLLPILFVLVLFCSILCATDSIQVYSPPNMLYPA